MRLLFSLLLLAAGGCTWHHSRQALDLDRSTTPSDNATFVSEEDSGLTLFRVATLSEPDHYAVLLERMRRRYRCASIHHLQMDLYTDDWLLLEFPIVRLTGICERESKSKKDKKSTKDRKIKKDGKADSGEKSEDSENKTEESVEENDEPTAPEQEDQAAKPDADPGERKTSAEEPDADPGERKTSPRDPE